MHSFTHSKPRPFASPCFSLRKPQGPKRNRLIIPPHYSGNLKRWQFFFFAIWLSDFCPLRSWHQLPHQPSLCLWIKSLLYLSTLWFQAQLSHLNQVDIVCYRPLNIYFYISFCVVTFSTRRLSTLHDERHESRKIKICWFKQAGQISLYGKCISHMSKLSYDSFHSLILPFQFCV